MMARVEPAVIGVAERGEGSNIDHAPDVALAAAASSVMHVTASLVRPVTRV
jgi:hypothetical protein